MSKVNVPTETLPVKGLSPKLQRTLRALDRELVPVLVEQQRLRWAMSTAATQVRAIRAKMDQAIREAKRNQEQGVA